MGKNIIQSGPSSHSSWLSLFPNTWLTKFKRTHQRRRAETFTYSVQELPETFKRRSQRRKNAKKTRKRFHRKVLNFSKVDEVLISTYSASKHCEDNLITLFLWSCSVKVIEGRRNRCLLSRNKKLMGEIGLQNMK